MNIRECWEYADVRAWRHFEAARGMENWGGRKVVHLVVGGLEWYVPVVAQVVLLVDLTVSRIFGDFEVKRAACLSEEMRCALRSELEWAVDKALEELNEEGSGDEGDLKSCMVSIGQSLWRQKEAPGEWSLYNEWAPYLKEGVNECRKKVKEKLLEIKKRAREERENELQAMGLTAARTQAFKELRDCALTIKIKHSDGSKVELEELKAWYYLEEHGWKDVEEDYPKGELEKYGPRYDGRPRFLVAHPDFDYFRGGQKNKKIAAILLSGLYRESLVGQAATDSQNQLGVKTLALLRAEYLKGRREEAVSSTIEGSEIEACVDEVMQDLHLDEWKEEDSYWSWSSLQRKSSWIQRVDAMNDGIDRLKEHSINNFNYLQSQLQVKECKDIYTLWSKLKKELIAVKGLIDSRKESYKEGLWEGIVMGPLPVYAETIDCFLIRECAHLLKSETRENL